jgi:hypothetical protein
MRVTFTSSDGPFAHTRPEYATETAQACLSLFLISMSGFGPSRTFSPLMLLPLWMGADVSQPNARRMQDRHRSQSEGRAGESRLFVAPAGIRRERARAPHDASSSSNALASFRSSVSKPSVNPSRRPEREARELRCAYPGRARAAPCSVGATNDRLSQHHLRIDSDPILRSFDLTSEPDGHSVD